MYKLKPQQQSESDVKRDVLRLLELHPQVAIVWRQNTGAHTFKDSNGKRRFVRYGFVGASDIMGMLRGGRFFSIETKRQDYKPQGEKQKQHLVRQLEFLRDVNNCGGLGILADDWTTVLGCIDDKDNAKAMAEWIEEKLQQLDVNAV